MLRLALAVCGFSVQGTVHTAPSGEPIAQTLVEATDGMAATESDSIGRYRLSCLPATTHAIRFSRLGFETRIVEVAAEDGVTIQLDVGLAVRPLPLPPVAVTGPPSGRRPIGSEPPDAAEFGIPSFTPADLSESPLVDDVDPLLGLPAPDALTGGDPLAGLHVRGGSADQNVTLLDGVPVYNPYHAGATSALSSNGVSRVTLASGVLPARWGGGLSSVAAVQTRTAEDGGVTWDGGADPLWIGQFLSSPIGGGAGDLLLGGRVRNELLGLHDHGHGASGADGLGRLTVPMFGGGLELLLFGSQDRIAFDTAVGQPGETTWQPASGDQATDNVAGSTGANSFAWATQTEALIWTGPAGRRANAEFRVWRTAFDATADWLVATPLVATSSLRDVGAAAVVSGTLLSSHAEIGVQADRYGATYAVRDLSPGGAPSQLLNERVAPVIVVGFLEDRWQSPGGRWGITAGLRSDFTPWGGVAFEPRLTWRFAPTPVVVLTAAYGASRQYVQSLGNAESILGSTLGVALPIAVDGARFPVGRSDQSTGSLTLRPTAGTIVTVDAYVRHMNGLVLVAPVTAEPFATSSIAIGSGQASGVLLSFEHHTARVTIQGVYAYGITTRNALGITYAPAADATHSLAAGIGVRGPGSVTFRTAIWASLGRRTSVIADSLGWSSPTELGGIGDMDGSPQYIRGPLDGQALPGYVRLDLGLRRQWSAILGRAARLTASISVNNVLGRVNVAALLEPVNVLTPQVLSFTGRTVTARLEWTH